MGKTPRVDDASPITASAPSSTGKTPPKGDEAEGSPRKKSPRLFDGNLPGASEQNLTGKTPLKEEAEGSTPKSPQQEGKLPAATGRGLATVPDSSELTVKGVEGYAIRGISNLGNTCYMSAVLQCLFVLGKLRERMLADHPKGDLPEVLKELFVEASAVGDVLDPTQDLRKKVLRIIGFKVGSMEDSHEFLILLRDIWIKSEQRYDSQALTVIDSLFQFHTLQEVSCKNCGVYLQPFDPCLDLQLNFPQKWHPTISAASPQTSESPRSRKQEIPLQLHPDVQRNLEKMQAVSESGSSRVIGSEVIVEKTHKPLELDSTQAQHISQSKDVVHRPLQIQDNKSVDSVTEGSLLIKDFFEPVKMRCNKCAKGHEEPSASQSKNGEQIVGSGNEDDVGDATLRFVTLPPVLVLHVNRTSYPEGASKVDKKAGIKISGHVRFEEYLDVKPFMDTRPKDSIPYRLAGVVEHIGEGSLLSGHYIAYVRARRLGNQQEGSSCSSSWFRADDIDIRQVTLEQVLNCEAYILFYERTEDQTPIMPDDIVSRWEVIKSDEIVDCNSDLEAPCYVYEKKLENIPWRSQIVHSKYTNYICNIIDNNKGLLERVQVTAEWAGQFSFVADSLLPVPLCSLSVKAASHINQARKINEVIGRGFQFLKSAVTPPEHYVAIGVANPAQARYAVWMWENALRSKWYCVEILDLDQALAVKAVLRELDALRLLWWYHPNL